MTIEQVLPNPSLIDPKAEVQAYVALKKRGTNDVTGLTIATEAEYIKGEREFFSKAAYQGQPYTKKALALMASLFKGGSAEAPYRAAAQASFPDQSMTSSDWSLFDADPDLGSVNYLSHICGH